MPGIDELRDEMDGITIQMTRLLKSRAEIALSIGRLKEEAGIPVSDESREEELRQKVSSLCGEIGLDRGAAARHLNFLLNESVRVQSGGRQAHMSIFHRAAELERGGRRIIHMELGEPDFGPPQEAAEALGEACSMGYTRYGGPAGRPEVREALAGHVSDMFHPISYREVMVSPGARFAVYSAVTSLLDPGDEMVTIEPAWPAYRDCAMHAGVKARAVSTTLEDGWVPDPGDIEDAITPDTRMIVLNYPNNPTGRVLPGNIQDEVMGIAARNGLYVLSDEVYSAYSDGWRSALTYEYEKCIAVQSFSKSHAMTGLRIGYAVARPETIQKMSGLAALCLTSVSEPIQYAAMRALGADTSGFAGTVRRRLEILSREAGKAGLEFAAPDGAMYLFARTGMDGTRLAEEALGRGLAVAPGAGFGEYPEYVRISACQNEKTLIDGMNILSGLVGSHR